MFHHGFAFRMGDAGRHWKAGRKLRRGILKYVILKFLAESERHGYDLMRLFAEKGWRPPRPGSIYPILNALEEEGFVRSRAEGDRRVYEITEKGRRHLSEHTSEAGNFFENFFEDEPDEAEAKPTPSSELRDAAERLMQAIGQIGPSSKPDTIERVQELLNKTRKEIYTLLSQE
jgi:DNA-binding PadR family transcriptional regulator